MACLNSLYQGGHYGFLFAWRPSCSCLYKSIKLSRIDQRILQPAQQGFNSRSVQQISDVFDIPACCMIVINESFLHKSFFPPNSNGKVYVGVLHAFVRLEAESAKFSKPVNMLAQQISNSLA